MKDVNNFFSHIFLCRNTIGVTSHAVITVNIDKKLGRTFTGNNINIEHPIVTKIANR